ncbi:hypothetical protein H8N01_18165 [Streptomyces sp. AC536]|uniref:hypothetical protein n=1 Tax=Streptomyces buecherae TaxID=2763006 RepID=UPI00164E0F8E|nr:hypothetical protein [Streptomyces buecherae]MBC3984442.1 hypothetical protein [Streptomyces buecherae]QNJ41032.1 hypothetical protein H7H31_15345 [Streptomyces buecherae]
MTPAYRWPPRHAPGFPPDCPDAGDVLARFAAAGDRAATLVVVTSGLRARVEDSGDHEAGLDRVRRSLAAVGRAAGEVGRPGYYGKDLVLVRAATDGPDEPPPAPLAAGDSGVRHGWAWGHVPLAGDADERRTALLRACYAVAMAARLRRDRPALPQRGAADALARVPDLLSVRATASLLAGVLVRPLDGNPAQPGAADGEDPRLLGVASADGLADLTAAPPAGGLYAVTDVHDIEWGTSSRAGDGARLTRGNARELLPLAEAWHAARTPVDELVRRAYPLRARREALLAGHLRALSDGVAGAGRLFATLGDGLSGVVNDAEALRTAVAGANRWSEGRMHSGAGAAPLDGADLDAARRRAHFSLHVTKTLKGTGHAQRVLHVYGEPLGPDAAEAAVAFLADLSAAGPGAPGAHHLAHALRWRDAWRRHLPPPRFACLERVLPATGRTLPAG